ncbi:sugar-binding transcriptional regulator [Oryzibacter oryziterrae]|uniref:sugar-binding transcriptional regulator n=1 Tax=Oryzibacter oryziterrae TaxID=2766474 RepID=UPI001F1B3039|nr:sugar-binding transcriptional regulator [Oryzibacter oryziterrae]
MARERDGGDSQRLEDAARAGWLYYIAGNTQDEIARKLGVSRQSAQRLVALAISERLIRFELDHPIARCLELGAEMERRFGLRLAEVVPTDPDHPGALFGVAHAAAAHLERHLRSPDPVTLGIGMGRTLKAAVDQMPAMDCPQHTVVSMTGNIAPDGAAAYFSVIFNIADKTKARSYPFPVPVIASSVEERDALVGQPLVVANMARIAQAGTLFVGIAGLGDNAPLLQDGFLSTADLKALRAAGAVGEITGWTFDRKGELIEGLTNARVMSAPLPDLTDRLCVAVAVGAAKVDAIHAAVTRPLVNGLITDEATAEALLARSTHGKV